MKRCFGILCGIAVVSATLATAAQAQKKPNIRKATFNPDDRTVELFEGMKSGELEAKIILKDSTKGKVFITNKSDKPVNVKLPEAFVAIHAQLGGFGGFGGNRGVQAGGGGFGGGGLGRGGGLGGGGLGGGGLGGGGGGGGGNFNIPPERVGELPVVCVCLEHGKREPNSRTKYELKPVSEFSDNPMLPEVLSLLARGEFPQQAAQAVAWHLTDGMSWQELVAKRNDNLNGTSTPYFSANTMMAAQKLYLTAKQRAENKTKDQKKSDSLGDRIMGSGH